MQKIFAITKLLAFAGILASLLNCAPKNQINEEPFQNQKQIVNGEAVNENDPIAASTVALYIEMNDTGRSRFQNICTGTLVQADFVMTAAHCLADVSESLQISIPELLKQLYVVFGTKIVTSKNDPAVRVVPLASGIVHSQYQVGSVARAEEEPMYDIALLKLSESAPHTARSARLGLDIELKKGMTVVLAGYGLTNGVLQYRAKSLNKVAVTINNPAINPVQFSYVTIGGKSACSGDSGGPAYYIDQGGDVNVIGVTSWGDEYCREIGAYTSVPAFKGWIMQTIATL